MTDRIVCPDDHGELERRAVGFQCSQCHREFHHANGILDLLPKESLQEASPEQAQLQHYASTFSDRPDKQWYRPLRLLVAELGNRYLYQWAARSIKAAARGGCVSLLDAGCGDGILRRFLPQRHSYAGVDFSQRLLLRAVRDYPGEYFRCDLNHLPFRDDTFDVAVSLQALQYLPDPERALWQLSRVLKNAGMLVLSLPNARSFKYRFQGTPAVQLQQFDLPKVYSLISRYFDVRTIEARGFWIPIPKITVHAPGIYPGSVGLSWSITAKKRK